jgi:glycosyltransferase involved in cell wall biosynthesis
VIVPARNEAHGIGDVVRAVRAQQAAGVEVEVIVVDDGSTDATARRAAEAGARVVRRRAGRGNPGAARNLGARVASGDPLVFLDADCVPAPGWLRALLAAHERGATVVGGSLDAPPRLPATARCDHYCGSYHVHPRRPAGPVPNHPPANLSVRAAAFRGTRGFTEAFPIADGHEELGWQAELGRAGVAIHFEPAAVVHHRNRAGIGNLMRRNYRWGYSALESKAAAGGVRFAAAYRHPRLLIAAGVPLALAHTAYTLGCWLRVRTFEPMLMLPLLLAARLAYAAGFAVGGVRWLRRRNNGLPAEHPRWR